MGMYTDIYHKTNEFKRLYSYKGEKVSIYGFVTGDIVSRALGEMRRLKVEGTTENLVALCKDICKVTINLDSFGKDYDNFGKHKEVVEACRDELSYMLYKALLEEGCTIEELFPKWESKDILCAGKRNIEIVYKFAYKCVCQDFLEYLE